MCTAPQAPYFEHNAYHFVTVVKHAALPEALLLSPMTPNCPMANHVMCMYDQVGQKSTLTRPQSYTYSCNKITNT